jgi:hypothetical protein
VTAALRRQAWLGISFAAGMVTWTGTVKWGTTDPGTGLGYWCWWLSLTLVLSGLLMAPVLLYRHPVGYGFAAFLAALLVMVVGFVGLLAALTLFLLPAVIAAWTLVFVGPPRTVQGTSTGIMSTRIGQGANGWAPVASPPSNHT